MVSTVETLKSAADQAWSVVEDASARAGVKLALLDSLDDLRDAARLYDSVWSQAEGDPLMPVGVLRALAQSGNYVVGAFSNGTMIGALCGFLGRSHHELHLHSHILGVVPEAQGRRIGFALKQHQRAWSLERGIGTVTWTFDPLVARNAYFNFTKLGTDSSAYFLNFYGEMNDGINVGEESDRLLIEWRLASKKATEASRGDLGSPEIMRSPSEGGTVILDEVNGSPTTHPLDGSSVLLSRTPSDIVSLRAANPAGARAWRQAQRGTLGQAIHDGYRVTGVTRSGWYILSSGR
jgi:predicted GNAT superfamily acetyltransferase